MKPRLLYVANMLLLFSSLLIAAVAARWVTAWLPAVQRLQAPKQYLGLADWADSF